MKMKVTYPLPSGATLEADISNFDQLYLMQLRLGAITDPREAFQEATRARTGLPIPDVCPLDGSPVRLVYRVGKSQRTGDEFDFYEVESTGSVRFKLKLGQYKDKALAAKNGALFVKDAEGWSWYDKEAKQEVIAFQYGNFIPDGFPAGWEPPAAQREQYPDGELRTGGYDSEGAQQPEARPSRTPNRTPATTGEDRAQVVRAQAYMGKVAKAANIPAERMAKVVGTHYGAPEWNTTDDVTLAPIRALREAFEGDRDGTIDELNAVYGALQDAGTWAGAGDELEDEELPF